MQQGFVTTPPPPRPHHLTYPASELLQLPVLGMASLLWQCRTSTHGHDVQ